MDIGAGDGDKAARVLEASKGAEVFAVDPAERKISYACRVHPELKASVGQAERLAFPGSHFDKVYTNLALHHFEDLDLSLREIARVLKGGGLFLVVEQEPGSLFGMIYRALGRLMGEELNFMSADELSARLASSRRFRDIRSLPGRGRYIVTANRA